MECSDMMLCFRDLCSQYPINMMGISACVAFLAGLLVGKVLSRTRPPKEVRRNERSERPERGERGRERGDRGDRGQSSRGSRGGNGASGSSSELYVGNLPYEMTEQELTKAFEKFGKVVSARIISSRSSGTSKGYGFVEMGDIASAKAARQGLDSEKVQGRRIVVSEAKSQPQSN